MARVQVVNPAELIDKFRPLIQSNWAETGFDFPFDPDVEAYDRLWDAG